MSICSNESNRRHFDSSQSVSCQRETGHFGRHQAIIDNSVNASPYLNVVWGEGGMGEEYLDARYWNECDYCGILVAETLSACRECEYWAVEAQKEDAPYRLIMDGAVFNVEPKETTLSTLPDEKLYTVRWYDLSRPSLVTNRVVRFGEIPGQFYDYFGDDNGSFEAKPSHNGFLVPYGRHINHEDMDAYLEEQSAKEYGGISCGKVINSYGKEFTCSRTENHRGEHQQIVQGYYTSKPLMYANAVWSTGLSVSPETKMTGSSCSSCGLTLFREKETCFSCDYWMDQLQHYGENSIIVDHHHYRIGTPGGHGGREFNIEFLDSSRPAMKTKRLWSQGAIPEIFWDKLPDNAVFVYPKKAASISENINAVAWKDLQELVGD